MIVDYLAAYYSRDSAPPAAEAEPAPKQDPVQRLLADVVAGFFILFEGQFAAGDLVVLDSTIPSAIVERAGLRATV